MKVYKFSNVLALPFFILLVYFLYRLIVDTNDLIAVWAVVPLTILVLIYLFQPQLDYWWLSKFPIEIDKQVLKMIETTNPFYNSLNDTEKAEFQNRMLLYVHGREFLAKGMEKDTEVPYDVMYMIAQVPISLSFRQKDFLLNNYDRVILYKHAFPSPEHKFLHTCEVNHEDGVIILSLEHAEASFFNPREFYNICWHVFSEVFLETKEVSRLLEEEDQAWKKLEEISGFSKSLISRTIGFETPDINAVALSLSFLYRDQFQNKAPVIYERIQGML